MAFKLDAEIAHELTIKSMHLLGPWVNNTPTDPRFKLQAMGLNFKSPIGLAAGLDKNAAAINFLTYLPFSFIEVGTVTPLPQEGNPKPRLFRYIEEESLRNCMGFNNDGADAIVKNIQNSDRREKILGANLGKNKLTPNEQAQNDYATLYEKFAPHSDYLVINVSSPNTPGLRDLLGDIGLREIFQAVTEKRKNFYRPLLVKVSPDMNQDELTSVVNLVKEYELSGIIATNTTIMPDRGAGGISGKLLYENARNTRKFLLEQLKETPAIELIGVGGFSSYEDCLDFWKMGGRLIQLYSAFVFQGPKILHDIEKKLADDMTKKNIASFDEFRSSL
ncbi:MAG: quinone-dependent dihydroorotate dehydrogenase [Bacteriovorax sp.]|nr:quinone-dependent dihydroorotate dehydrogenase [Bacteriovorax sp.]